MVLSTIFRWKTPPCALTYAYHACSATGIVLYRAAGPVYGNVPPIRICLLDTPGVPWGEAPATPATAAVTRSAPNSAPSFLRFKAILPPANGSSVRLCPMRRILPQFDGH